MVRLRSVLTLCLVPLLSLAAPSPFTQYCNETLHFDCHDSSKPCIPLEWICDGVHDCPNGLDEAKCSYLHDCAANQLMCRDGECISSSFRCDGTYDCLDGSDEKGCEEMEEIMDKTKSARPTQPSSPFLTTTAPRRQSAPAKCGIHEYQCRVGACIDEAAKCDGIWDCPNGDDETDCGQSRASPGLPTLLHCDKGSHMCADRITCIPANWKCDGQPDCDDESDEAHCDVDDEEEVAFIIEEMKKKVSKGESTSDLPSAHEFLSSTSNELCDEGHFRCKGGMCLNSSLTCDGKADCPFGDDESERCKECASHMDHKCSHVCTNTPTGHKCSCPRGMILGSDEWTCEDFNECLHDGQRCSQFCVNVHDGYECSCAAGYELAKDRHTCHIRDKDMNGIVYVSLAGEIRSAPMFSPLHSTKGYETYLNTNHHGTTKNLALDVTRGKMFTACEPKTHDGVLASVENGQMKKLRENVTGINYVAVDWINGNVLYTVRHPSPSPGIYLCKMNGLYCKRIIKGANGANKKQIYKGLAVNPLKGIVAWIEGAGTEHKIVVANLDGSDKLTVVDDKLSYPSGITFDVIKNEIYFSDVDTRLIEKLNLESGRRTTVLYPVNHPYDLAYFDNLIYWTEWGTQTLKVASVGVQHSTPHLIHGFLQFPYGIALNNSYVQPTLRSNPCDLIACPWLCVAVRRDESGDMTSSPLEARCVCPDEYEANAEYNATIKGSLPCKMKKDLDTELMSHVSVEAMEEYCKSGEVCMNGGSCVEHANTHGRVDRITCKCAEGYGGLWCEVPPLPDADSLDGDDTAENDSQNGGSTVNVATIIALVLLLAVIGGLIYWGSRNTDEISEITRSTIHRVQEARLPERASEAIKNTTRNLGKGSSMAPSSSFSARNGSTVEATTAPVPPPPPSMYPSLSTRSKTAPSLTSVFSINFTNPSYDERNSTAAHTGVYDMNTTEPSYFTIDRADGQEAHGTNPFGRLP